MTNEIRTIIEAADFESLRRSLERDPARAEELVRWGPEGKNAVPPLHFVCDAVFRGLASQEQALAMADVLLAAGVDPDRAYAKSGDTYLIAAASLGAGLVGERLVAVGADVTPRGLFGATALHWAAHMGLDGLARALVERGADLELRDERYDCTPLEWALHGWREGTSGRRDGLPLVARVLVAAGARVPDGVEEALRTPDDDPMRAALRASG